MRRLQPERPIHLLDPMDRLSEVLFGLIMVLTFTGSLSVAQAGREDVRSMLIAALGCNLAWGVIDGVFYLMARTVEAYGGLATVRAVRRTRTPADAHRLIAEALPAEISSALEPGEFEAIRARLVARPEPPARVGLSGRDWLGALAVTLWVFVTTFPVVIPFIVMRDPRPALRVSNAVAIALLYVAGHVYGRMTARSPVWIGVGMVALGAGLVSLTIALGG